MQDTDAQQLLVEILRRADEEEFTQFCYITSWQEFRFYQKLVKANQLVIGMLDTSINKLVRSYCKAVIAGISDVTELLACNQLRKVQDFYYKDIEIINNMLAEYEDYLGQGHFWYSFLGGERRL
jgi:hypothetical protein